jgi:hypothetical protein
MISSGANPTVCEILIDGQRCNEPSAFVLKTAFATRLCCPECARRYKAEGVTAPLLELALMELIPAREALEQELKMTVDMVEKMNRLAVLAANERRLQLHLTLVVCAIGLAFWWGLFAAGRTDWALAMPIVFMIGGEAAVRWAIGKFWRRPRVSRIMAGGS